jgi:hypothetical protein
LTGSALPTFHVGAHCHDVASAHGAHLCATRYYLDGELVPEYPRVGEKGLLAGEGVQIGATNADTAHPHGHFARARVADWVDMAELECSSRL